MHPTIRDKIYHAIDRERDYQDKKWGDVKEHPHEVASWLLIMKKELQEAEDAWMKTGDDEAIREVVQVIATGVACLEQHGVQERIFPPVVEKVKWNIR